MKQVLINNFAKAVPGNNDPTPASELMYRLYVSRSPNMDTVTGLLTNGELVETAVTVNGQVQTVNGKIQYVTEKKDADEFIWITDRENIWYLQIAVVSPIGGISVSEGVQSIDLTAENNFRILVDTTKSGVSANNQFQLTGATGTYFARYDGKTQELTGQQTLTFSSPGQHVIDIYGGLERVAFDSELNNGDGAKLIEIQQWGAIKWKTFFEAFFNCINLKVTATIPPIMTDVVSTLRMFTNNNAFIPSASIESMDVSPVGDLQGMFNTMRQNDPEWFEIDLTEWTFRDDLATTGNLNRIFRNSGLHRRSYSQFLVSQANKVFANGGPLNVSMTELFPMKYTQAVYDQGGQFNNAIDARNYLVNTAGWTITQDEQVDGIPPVISDPNLTVTVTDIGYTVGIVAASDNDTAAVGLEYVLVEGAIDQISDDVLIRRRSAAGSASNTTDSLIEITVNRASGFISDINVYVKDQAGNISLYDPTTVVLDDPEITEFSLEQTQIQGDEGDTVQLSWTIQATDGADETVNFESSSVAKVTVNANGLVTLVEGGLVDGEYPTIRAYPAFYGSFNSAPVDQRAEIDVIVNVYENDTPNESPIWEFETIS